jgi:hypothetical protein
MTKHIFGMGVIVAIATAALIIGGGANAEPAANADAVGKTEWKTPQVTGSAPVKAEPKSDEAKAPRSVGQSTKGAVTRE